MADLNKLHFISAKDAFEFRDYVGCSIEEAKEALKEANGDFAKAIECIKKKGQTLHK